MTGSMTGLMTGSTAGDTGRTIAQGGGMERRP
jgi:hypothetical protein